MAWRRQANALVSKSGIRFDEWMDTLRAQNEGVVPKDYTMRVAKEVLRKCDPKQYLLSHATIVASVDTYAPKGVKTGLGMNRGVQIDVRFPDFRIKPECHDLINNNLDGWERSLLLSTYRTFVGAPGYLEHIQLPELSKGFIVDAVARDLGRTCYIDILVATDRKHTQLINDVLSGQMDSFSMGCISQFTICTKCGNVAADDSQSCPCITYDGKGSVFLDEDGVQHKVSELIGHVSVPNSNQFIEASWVRTPAFKGAVRRNFLGVDSPHLAAKMESAMNSSRIPEIDGTKKAASVRLADDQGSPDPLADLDIDAPDDAKPGDAPPDTAPESDSPPDAVDSSSSDKIDQFLDKAQEQILTLLVEKLGDRLQSKPEDVRSVAPIDLMEGNNNLSHSASRKFQQKLHTTFSSLKLIRWASRTWNVVHVGGLPAIRRAKLSSRDLIVLSWIEDRVNGRMHSSSLYKLAIDVGPMKEFPSQKSYLAACSVRSARPLTDSDNAFLVWKGRVASIV